MTKEYSICKECQKKFVPKNPRFHKFCSYSCSASFNNRERYKNKPKIYCLYCNKELTKKQKKFCSSKCFGEYKTKIIIDKWIDGTLKTARTGKQKSLRKSIRRYLIRQSNSMCSICGWSEINPNTGLVPLIVHHIDENFLNNKRDNLQVVCPNCHSILGHHNNKGNGRRKILGNDF